MNKEFKKITSKNETRYILETASVGGTSAGDIGSAISNLETIHRRIQELKKTVTVPTKPPRNPVGMGSTPGRGTQKHVRSDRKKEKDSKKIFELDDNGKKIFIKFRLSELPNEETRIIMFGGVGNKPKDVKRQDSIFAPVSIDYKDIDDSIVKIKNILTDLDVDENSKIFIDVPSYLNDILEDLKEAIENEIFDDNKNIEFYRKDDTDASLKRDDEEDSLNYLVTHPKNPVFFKSKSNDDSEKSDSTDKEMPSTTGENLIIPTTVDGNRFIKQLVSIGTINSNDIKLIGNTLYISKKDFEKVKDELRNNFKERDIHKYFPVKKVMRENKERDHEIEMARNELKSIIADAQKIMSKLKKYSEEEGIMAWQQSKITKSADFMNSVNQSLDENNSANLKKKVEEISEDLRKWFKEKWVRFGPDGKIRGACARGSKAEGKPKCLPQSKAHALGKKGRASAASRKRREDPNPERKGSAINVKTKESRQGVTEGFDGDEEYYGIIMNMIEGEDGFKLTARSPDGEKLGFVEFSYDTRGTIRAEELEVYAEHRGQGIAKTMYDYVKNQGFKIARSHEQTPDGAKFWDKNRPGERIWEQGVAEGSEQINWIKPNFDFEWHEVEEQSKMKQVPIEVRQYYQKHFPNKEAWLKSVQNGRVVTINPDHNFEIRNAPYDKESLMQVLAPTGHEGPIGPAKQKRVNALFDKGGPIEMPIILKTSNGLWLIGGKTRLGTANYIKGIPAKVWMIGGEQGVAEGNNSSSFNQEQNLRSKSNKELADLIQFWNRALEKNPENKNAREQLGLIKMIRAERIGKKGVAEGSGLNQNAGIGIDGKSFKFNVKDLISFAEKYPIKEVDPTQFKSQLDSRDEDPKQSMDRSKKADLQYPIIAVKRKNNSLWIADGTHRAQKAIMNNAPSIKAKIIPIDDMDQFSVNNDKNIDESCWDTHKQVGMKKKGSKMVPNCVPKEGKTMKKEKCPQCGGPIFPESVINEKKDACYYKVKSRYKVWPSAYACVPEETSKALTRDGWKSVDELSMGEEIMTYNMKKDIMEFKPILNLHRYNNVITNVVKSGNTGFMFECTPNHKWVVKLPEQNSDRVSKYDKINGMVLLETNQMLDVKNNKHLVVTAPYEDGKYLKKDKIFKYGDNWIKYILEISSEQRQSWLFSAIVYDGDQRKTERITENKKGINDLDWEYSGNHGKQSFGFKQKDIMHRDAFLLAAFLNGGTVTWKKYTNRDIYSCHFVNNKRYKNLWNFKNTKENLKNVWCPETENNTWVMMQETNGNGIITITGNSGALVKCRKQGSKNWGSKKEDMQYENYKQRLNSTLVELNEQEEVKIQEKNLKMIKKLVNPENVKAASVLSNSQKEAMMNNAAAQPEMQKNPLELIKFALDIGYSPEDVLASVPPGLDLSKDLPKA